MDVDGSALRTQGVVQKILIRKEDRIDAGRGRSSRLSDAASTVAPSEYGGGGTKSGRSRGYAASEAGTIRINRDATFKTALTSETSDTRRGGDLGQTRPPGPGGFANANEFEGFVQVSFPTHVDDPLVNDNIKEAMFKRVYARVTEYVRVKEIRNIPAHGEELMDRADESRFRDERREMQQRADEARRMEDALRHKSILKANAAVRKLDVRPPDDRASPSPRMSPSPSPRRGGLSPQRAMREAAVEDKEKLPSFVIYENNDWLKRMMALERFRVAARVILMRIRLRRRLEKLKNVIKQAKYQPDKVDEVAREILQKGQAPKKPKKGQPAPHEFKMDPEKLRIGILGVAWGADAGSSSSGVPLEIGNPQGYHQIDPLPLKVPLQYKLLGYSEEEIERCTDYFPPLLDQPLLAGAPEEEAAASTVPIGDADGVDPAIIRAPPAAVARPQDFVVSALKIGTRYTEDLRHYPSSVSWGLDERYRLQPRAMPYENKPASETIGTNAIRTLIHSAMPLLADLPGWTPARRVTEWPHAGIVTDRLVPAARMMGPDAADDLGGMQDGADELGLGVDVEPQVPKPAEVCAFLPEAIARQYASNMGASSTSEFKMYWRRNPIPAAADIEDAVARLPSQQDHREWHRRMAERKGAINGDQKERMHKLTAAIKRPGWNALEVGAPPEVST